MQVVVIGKIANFFTQVMKLQGIVSLTLVFHFYEVSYIKCMLLRYFVWNKLFSSVVSVAD